MLHPTITQARSIVGRTVWSASAFLLCLGLTSIAGAQDDDDIPPDVCKPEVKAKLSERLEYDDEILAQGKKAYELNCASCHGNTGKGDGIAGKALNPPARNFTNTEGWKNGPSAFGIFNTLAQGIAGSSMAAFDHLPEDQRWAMAHYIRQEFVPEKGRVEPTDEELETVCIELSQPPKLPRISTDLAMTILLEEQKARREKRLKKYGAVLYNEDGDVERGRAVWGNMCANCHGDRAQGVRDIGKYGRWPFVRTSTRPLTNEVAGGDWTEFTARVGGYHATIPDMAPVAFMNEVDWKSMHRFLSTLRGNAEVKSDEPPAPVPTLVSATTEYDLYVVDGRAFKLDRPQDDPALTDGTITTVRTWEAFKAAWKPIVEGDALPEEGAPYENIVVKGYAEMDCIGRTNGTPDQPAGCGVAPEEGYPGTLVESVQVNFDPPPAPEEAPDNP